MLGTHFLIGLSDRTNAEGAGQLGQAIAEFGCTWTTIDVAAGLHFKSSVNAVGEETLLTTPDFAGHPALAGYRRIVISTDETYAGNTLLGQRAADHAGGISRHPRQAAGPKPAHHGTGHQ